MFVRDDDRMTFLALCIDSVLTVSPHVKGLALAVSFIHTVRQCTLQQMTVRSLMSQNLAATVWVLVTSRVGVFPVRCATFGARSRLSPRQRRCLKLVESKWGHLARKVVKALMV